MEQIIGIIKQVIYTGDNNYAIVSVKPKRGKIFTAVGEIREPVKNAGIILYGDFVINKKRNEKQFKVEESVCLIDKEKTTAKSFLTTLHGLGESKAEAITDLLGNNIPAIFEHPEQLKSVSGISDHNLGKIIASYNNNKDLYPIYQIVQGDITLNQAKTIYRKYGEDSAKVLKKNPYVLINDLDNFGFFKVDKIARNSGIEECSVDRIKAAIVHVITDEANKNGHCYLYESKIKEKAIDLLYPLDRVRNVYYEDVLKTKAPTNRLAFLETSLGALFNEHEKIYLNMLESWGNESSREKYAEKYDLSTEEQDAVTGFLQNKKDFLKKISDILNADAVDMSGLEMNEIVNRFCSQEYKDAWFVKEQDIFGNAMFFSKNVYKLEFDIASKLIDIKHRPDDILQITEEDIQEKIKEYEAEEGYPLGEEQVNAIRTSLQNRASVITGGPGRGKTTIIKLIADLWMSQMDDNDIYTVIMLAPTGRAAQRMTESTGYEAQTIHRYLAGKHDESKKLTLFIVDECSMEDLFLARRLLNAVDDARIIFVGDIDQLPCVGIGKFFEDVIKSGIIPCTRLITCYRSSGSISANADIINNGGKPKDLIQDHMTKIAFIEDNEALQQSVLAIYKKSLETYDISDICVLVPMKERGLTCAKTMNKVIQNECNPLTNGKTEIRINSDVAFREGDRVIYTKNNYEVSCIKRNKHTGKIQDVYGIFNGETGIVKKITPDAALVQFDDGKESWLSGSDLALLNLAYAMTIHKSQGSEYKCLIVALSTSDYILLKKKLFYTGESRAKQILYLLGMKKAFWKAMTTTDDDIRNTMLEKRIKDMEEYYKQNGGM